MTTIQVTAQPEYAAQQLTITTLETIAAITRSDANGVGEVRTLPGILPWTAPRVEDLRNYQTNPTTGAGFNFTRSTLVGSVGSSFTQAQADGTGTTYLYQAATIPVVGGDPIASNLDVRNSNAFAIRAKLSVSFYDAAGAGVGAVLQGALLDVAPGATVYPSLTGTAPAGATQARALLYWFTSTSANPAAGTTVDWKYWAFYKGPKAWANADVFFHGAFAASDVYEYAWAGTGYASESIRYVAQDLVLTDYEAASGAVSYTAGNATQASSWAIPGPWLMVPTMPAYSVQLETLLEYSAGGQSLGTVHELLGRNDPVAILRGMGTRRGTLRLYCGTFAQALTVAEATKRGEVLMLRQPEHEGMDMYFVATSYGIPTLDTNGGASVFGLDVSYVEVSRPVAALSGSLGWTFAALASTYPSFASLPGKYATFQDVLLNEPK